ncbi:MAG: flagellar filament capping protein FliD [Gammaproteobacteria bacterium]|nr:flagellar filament capping protein FliD [Gammaproteobacteria bacterium]
MPTISSTGIGSGLDVSGLVEKLVAAEGEPVRIRLDRKEAELQAGLSAMGTFKGVVSEFQTSLEGLRNPDAFESISVTSSEEDKVEATASRGAQEGTYELDIIQLAQAHKLASQIFESDRLPVGSGTLSIQLGKVEADTNQFVMNPDVPAKTITISEDKGSLRGIAETINKSEASIRASVVNDGNGFRLILSSTMAGDDNQIRITVNDNDRNDSDLNGLSAFTYDKTSNTFDEINTAEQARQRNSSNMEELVATQDAKLRIDGLQVTSSSNEIDKVIDGLTINLKPEAEGNTVRLNVALSTDGITRSINDFVAKYNEMIFTVGALTGYDPETKTAGPLSGDASIRGVVSQIRRTLGNNFGQVNPVLDSLSSVGVDTERDGTLTVDSSKLQRAIETNFQQVAQLFSIAGSSSDPAVKYLQASDETNTNTYELFVSKMASQGAYGSRHLEGFPLILNSDAGSFRIKIDGHESQAITLPAKDYSNGNILARDLQNLINSDASLQNNDASVEVYFKGDRLLMVSRRYGSGSSVELTQADNQLKQVLGLQVTKGVKGEDIAGSFSGDTAIGTGQILTGQRDAKGLQVEVTDGEEGDRGQVFFSYGIGARLHDLTERFLKQDGIISVRSEGYSDRINDIAKEREKLAQKLEQSEQRYLKKFTNLDATLGKMRSTGDYLQKQLASLPGAAGNQGNKN